MIIAQVDYIPISMVPSANNKNNQMGSLYLDEEEFKKVKKETGYTGYLSMTEFRLSGYGLSFNFNSLNFDNYAESLVAASYDGHNKDRGFKTFVGWIVDTLA